eukprot:PhF_6_TR42945/c0_g1_i2/m.65266
METADTSTLGITLDLSDLPGGPTLTLPPTSATITTTTTTAEIGAASINSDQPEFLAVFANQSPNSTLTSSSAAFVAAEIKEIKDRRKSSTRSKGSKASVVYDLSSGGNSGKNLRPRPVPNDRLQSRGSFAQSDKMQSSWTHEEPPPAPAFSTWYSKGFAENDPESMKTQKMLTFFAQLFVVIRVISFFATWKLAPVQLTYLVFHLLLFFLSHSAYYSLKTHRWLRMSTVSAIVCFPIVAAVQWERPLLESPGGVLCITLLIPCLWTSMGGTRFQRDVLFFVVFSLFAGLVLYDFAMFSISAAVVIEYLVEFVVWLGYTLYIRFTYTVRKSTMLRQALIQEATAIMIDDVWSLTSAEMEVQLGPELHSSETLQNLVEILRLIEDMRKHHPTILEAEVRNEMPTVPSWRSSTKRHSRRSVEEWSVGNPTVANEPSAKPALADMEDLQRCSSIEIPAQPLLGSGAAGTESGNNVMNSSEANTSQSNGAGKPDNAVPLPKPGSARFRKNAELILEAPGAVLTVKNGNMKEDYEFPQSPTVLGKSSAPTSFETTEDTDGIERRDSTFMMVGTTNTLTLMLVEVPEVPGQTHESASALVMKVFAHVKIFGGLTIWSCGLEVYIGFTESKLGPLHCIAAATAAWHIFSTFGGAGVCPFVSLSACSASFGLLTGNQSERAMFMGSCVAIARCRELNTRAKKAMMRLPQVDDSVAQRIADYFCCEDNQLMYARADEMLIEVEEHVAEQLNRLSKRPTLTTRKSTLKALSMFNTSVSDVSGSTGRASFADEDGTHLLKKTRSIADLVMNPTPYARNGTSFRSSRSSSQSSSSVSHNSRSNSLFTVDAFNTAPPPNHIMAEIQSAWNRYDKRKAHFISAEDLWWLLHDLGLRITSERFYSILQIVDTEGCGVIGLETFVALYESDALLGPFAVRSIHQSLKAQGMSSQDALSKATGVWKAACKGSLFQSVDSTELRSLFKKMKINLTPHDADLIIKEIGENGQMNFDQFATLMSFEDLSQHDEVMMMIRMVQNVYTNTQSEKKYSNSEQVAANKARVRRTNFDKVFLPLLMLYTVYVALELPFTASLEPFLFTQYSDSFLVHKVVISVADVVFALWCVSKFFLGVEVGPVFIYKRKDVARHYLRSFEFLIDVAAVIPLDAVMYWAVHDYYYPVGLIYRMNKMLVVAYMDRLYRTLTSDWSPVASRLMRTVMWFYLIIHFFACVFIGVARLTHDETPEGTNLDRTGVLDRDYETYLFSGVPQYFRNGPILKYMIAFDWAQKTMYGLGSGQPIAPLDIQVAFSLLTVIVGVCLLTVFISSVSNALVKHGPEAQYLDRLELVHTFFRHIEAVPESRSLQLEIEDYYKHMFTSMRSLRIDDDPLHDLNQDLWVRVQVTIAHNLFSRVPIFSGLVKDTGFLYCLIRRCKPRVLLPFEIVYKKGEQGSTMFIVSLGLCVSWNAHCGPVEYGTGGYFGEIQLMHSVPRTETVECYDRPTNVFELDRSDFTDVMTHFPQFLKVVQTAIRSALREIAVESVMNGSITMVGRKNAVTGGGGGGEGMGGEYPIALSPSDSSMSLLMGDDMDASPEDAAINMWLESQEKSIASETESVASKHKSILARLDSRRSTMLMN